MYLKQIINPTDCLDNEYTHLQQKYHVCGIFATFSIGYVKHSIIVGIFNNAKIIVPAPSIDHINGFLLTIQMLALISESKYNDNISDHREVL